jgi:hypothetical protein
MAGFGWMALVEGKATVRASVFYQVPKCSCFSTPSTTCMVSLESPNSTHMKGMIIGKPIRSGYISASASWRICEFHKACEFGWQDLDAVLIDASFDNGGSAVGVVRKRSQAFADGKGIVGENRDFKDSV